MITIVSGLKINNLLKKVNTQRRCAGHIFNCKVEKRGNFDDLMTFSQKSDSQPYSITF